jgi:hypothetical protein
MTAEKIYFVRETQFGYTIEGPNGHKWQATPEDGWQRAVAFAKALERAFLEGQKSITTDMDLMVAFELIKTLGEDENLSTEDLQSRIRIISRKADKAAAKLEAARQSNTRERTFRDDPEGRIENEPDEKPTPNNQPPRSHAR